MILMTLALVSVFGFFVGWVDLKPQTSPLMVRAILSLLPITGLYIVGALLAPYRMSIVRIVMFCWWAVHPAVLVGVYSFDHRDPFLAAGLISVAALAAAVSLLGFVLLAPWSLARGFSAVTLGLFSSGLLLQVTQVPDPVPFAMGMSVLVMLLGVLLVATRTWSRDLSDQRLRIQEQRRETERQRERAALASSRKSRFLERMSHQLRTPLSTVIGFVELIKEDLSTPHGEGLNEVVLRRDLVTVRKAAQGLLDRINDVLALSRYQSGGDLQPPQQVDVGTWLADGLAPFKTHAAESGLTFEVNGPQLTWFGPVHETSDAVRQLVHNALSFTKTGSVRVVYQPLHSGLRIDVVDTGRGLRPKHLERVFEPFERVDVGERDGSGLGLTLTAAIVSRLSGWLHADSTPGVGSRFTLWIPSGEVVEAYQEVTSRTGPLPGVDAPAA